MLNNIFLLVGKNFHDLEQLNIYNYPTELISIDQSVLISNVISSHDRNDLINKSKNHNLNLNNPKSSKINSSKNKSHLFLIDSPVPQILEGLNIYSSCINEKIIIGLIFDSDDNPYDYKDIFQELLNELLNIEKICAFEDEMDIENFLITVFIDIRRFADEYIEKRPESEYQMQEVFIKAFLFGIDDVGKTSFVRRVKTGKFDDNYFMPTKKFNIDYIQVGKKGTLAWWDMPGQRTFRKKWLIGLQDSNILIYMIDIANQRRFEESKKEFWKVINRYELVGVPLLILGNKIDLIQNLDESPQNQIPRLKKEVIENFEFDKIENRDWKLLFTSVKTNFNMDLAINTIFDLLESSFEPLN